MTLFHKGNGPLTKRIRLDKNGHVVSDGSACIMGAGTAERVRLDGVHDLAALIDACTDRDALGLGALRPDLPDRCAITIKRKLVNGTARPDLIARTADAIRYAPQQPAYVLFDADAKGIPPEVAARIRSYGGIWRTLITVLPALANIARVRRLSTSAGLYRDDTGEDLSVPGRHIYGLVRDGADIERFLAALHQRLWLAGLGWFVIGAGGQLLERSIIDRMVGASERLVFEGPPVLEPPLAQHRDRRRPEIRDGEALDTIAGCPSLSIVEQAKFRELRAKASRFLAPAIAAARKAFVGMQVSALVARAGISRKPAEKIAAMQCRGVLLPHLILPFDDDGLAGATVADVLADPARFDGETLADPLEGVEYGRGKARIMLRADGTPWIHSFAHGRTTYHLRHDAEAVRQVIKAAPKDDVVNVFVRAVLDAEIEADALQELIGLVAARSKVGKIPIKQALKAAQKERQREHAREERRRLLAERSDPRPQLPVPCADEPYVPQMESLNEVLAAARDPVPPSRDIDGDNNRPKLRRLPRFHLLATSSANPEDNTDG